LQNAMSAAEKQAFEYSLSEGDAPSFWSSLKYLVKLHELDPNAVTVQRPKETGGDFTRVVYNEVYEDGDLGIDLAAIELWSLCPHNQKEAAEICQVSVRTLQRWAKQGLPSIRVKGQVLYDEDELRNFMEEIGHHPGCQRLGNGNQKAKI